MGELEKVRSILFGEQIRAHEARLAEVEEALRSDVQGLREEMTARFTALEASMMALAGRLEERLDAEASRRGADDTTQRAELAGLAEGLQKAQQTLQERIESLDRSTRASLDERAGDVSAQLTARLDALAAHVEQAAAGLDAAKVDRRQLATFMNQLADRLSAGDGA